MGREIWLSDMSGVFGVMTGIFMFLRSFFSTDTGVVARSWYRRHLDLFIVLILIVVGWALVYLIVFPQGTPPYP